MANDFMNCRIRTSLRLFGMPHKKNSAVTRKKGTSCPAGKSGRRPDPLVVGLAAFDVCIECSSVPEAVFSEPKVKSQTPRASRLRLQVPSPLVHAHHDLLDPGRIIAPCRQSLRSFTHGDDRTDRVVHRKAMFFQHADDIAKI